MPRIFPYGTISDMSDRHGDGGDYLPLRKAADEAGVSRHTLGRWVKARKLASRDGTSGGLPAKLVSVAEVRRLVGDGLKAGRPASANVAGE